MSKNILIRFIWLILLRKELYNVYLPIFYLFHKEKNSASANIFFDEYLNEQFLWILADYYYYNFSWILLNIDFIVIILILSSFFMLHRTKIFLQSLFHILNKSISKLENGDFDSYYLH